MEIFPAGVTLPLCSGSEWGDLSVCRGFHDPGHIYTHPLSEIIPIIVRCRGDIGVLCDEANGGPLTRPGNPQDIRECPCQASPLLLGSKCREAVGRYRSPVWAPLCWVPIG